MNKKISLSVVILLIFALFTLYCGRSENDNLAVSQSGLKFEISFPVNVHPEDITGRVYVMLSRDSEREPRLQIGTNGVPFFGKDVENLKPGEAVVIDERIFGYLF